MRGFQWRRGTLVLALLGILVVSAVLSWPAAAQAQPRLLVSDVSRVSDDEQLLFAALQGLVNRPALRKDPRRPPRIYLVGLRNGGDRTVDPTAETWLRDIVPLPTLRVSPHALLQRFRSKVRGLVVWDPALAIDTQNVATTMAGLRDLLPVSPALAQKLERAPYRLPVAADLRQQHFRSREQAYDWALTHLGPPRRFGLLAWLGYRGGRAGQHGIRDLVVARRGFAFEADPKQEWQLATRILDSFPYGTPVFGYPFFDESIYHDYGVPVNEPLGVGEISRSGKFLIPSTNSTNLTVHSWFRAQPVHTRWEDQPRPADPRKTYVAFLISDGDNIGYVEGSLRTRHFDDPARGSIPMGVSISPWLQVYAPQMYGYYVHALSPNDVLVSGPSGAGYVYPTEDPDLDRYLQTTRRLIRLAGLHSVWILDNGYATSPPAVTVERYVEALRPAAIFADYGGYFVPNPPPVSFQGGVPVVHAMWGDAIPPGGEDPVAATVRRVRLAAETFPGRPAFVLVALNTWTMGYSQAKAVMQRLGPSYEVVRPDHFAGLLKGAYPIRP